MINMLYNKEFIKETLERNGYSYQTIDGNAMIFGALLAILERLEYEKRKDDILISELDEDGKIPLKKVKP